jgi:hypothetical protein
VAGVAKMWTVGNIVERAEFSESRLGCAVVLRGGLKKYMGMVVNLLWYTI